MKSKVSKEMGRRIVKSFLDIAMMSKLMDGNPMSGYDVIMFVHSKFRILLSSGTVYSALYSMEREGLVRSMWSNRKRVYELTEKGEKTIETMRGLIEETQRTVKLLVGSK